LGLPGCNWEWLGVALGEIGDHWVGDVHRNGSGLVGGEC
jgi:hypothetical protein